MARSSQKYLPFASRTSKELIKLIICRRKEKCSFDFVLPLLASVVLLDRMSRFSVPFLCVSLHTTIICLLLSQLVSSHYELRSRCIQQL